MTDLARSDHKGLVERFLDRLESWARGDELDRMPAEEVQRFAHDVGLNALELDRLSHLDPNASRLLYQRLESLGLDMKEIEGQGFGARRDMERLCATCSDRAICEHDLSERPDSVEWRRFCPNSEVFEVMEQRRQGVKA